MATPENKPAPVRTNRRGLIAAALLFAVIIAFLIYFASIPARIPQ